MFKTFECIGNDVGGNLIGNAEWRVVPLKALLLPDLYGMKQPRWLSRIVLEETTATTSFWERRGWAGEVPVKTMSRIDRGTIASLRFGVG